MGRAKKKKEEQHALVEKPQKTLTLWYFKLLFFWFLRCRMQEELFITHTRVAAEKPFRFPGNSFCRRVKQCNIQEKKISLFIQLPHLITFAINFQGEVKCAQSK